MSFSKWPSEFTYQVGGSVPPQSQAYVKRRADDTLLNALLANEFCYVFNARQMGKSSLRLQTMMQLQQQGVSCAAIDLTAIGSQKIEIEQWYAAIAAMLSKPLQLPFDLRQWWKEHFYLPPAARLGEFIEAILRSGTTQRLVIFIDEIDAILNLKFPTDDFFALIRTCYNRRAETDLYRGLSFALFGVTTPGELIADKSRTPFNIGQAIPLTGFQPSEVVGLVAGLRNVMPEPEKVLSAILNWTNGQPFLVQKLCALTLRSQQSIGFKRDPLNPSVSGSMDQFSPQEFVDRLVQDQILSHWEASDEPEHLKTIRDRLLYDERSAGRRLMLYRQICRAEVALLNTVSNTANSNTANSNTANSSLDRPFPSASNPTVPLVEADGSAAQTELLLSGIVEKCEGYLRIKCRIYRDVFNLAWVDRQLDELRPYANWLNAWVESDYRDASYLLRGSALQEALDWMQKRSLDDLDYRYLAASQELEQQEIQRQLELDRLQEAEARLAIEQRSVRRQRQLLVALSITLIVSLLSGGSALVAYQRAAVSDVQSTIVASRGSFASDQHLDALLQALQARDRFQQLKFLPAGLARKLDRQTHDALERAIYGGNEKNQRLVHSGGALSTDFSPDGQWIVTTGTDRTAKIWRQTGELVHTLKHSSLVYDATFSPDGQKLLTASLDGRIWIWERNSGKLLTSFVGHESGIWSVDWSRDGQYIASASSDLTAKIWFANSGKLKVTLRGHKSTVWSVSFHPNTQQVISTGIDGQMIIWSLAGKPLRQFNGGVSAVWDAIFSPDGQQILSAHADNYVRQWRADGTPLRAIKQHEAAVINVAFSADGQRFASASADRTVRLWETATGRLLRIYPGHAATIRGLSYSADGKTLASVGEDGVLRLWATNSDFFEQLHDHPTVVWRVVYAGRSSPLYPQVATITSNDVQFWRRNGQPVQAFRNISAGELYSLALHPTRPQFVAGDANGTLTWVDTVRDRRQSLMGSESPIHGAAFSPDGRYLAAVGDDLHFNLWRHDDEGRYVRLQRFPAHKARIWDVAFSPDGSYVATSSTDSTVKLWTWADRARGRLREQPAQVLKGTGSGIWGVAIRADSEQIAAASRNQDVRVWNRRGQLLRTIPIGGNSGLTRIAWSPDGRLLAIAKNNSEIELRSPEGSLITTLSGHRSIVSSVAFSPDGQQLASGSEDRTAALWHVERVTSLDSVKYGCRWAADRLRSDPQEFDLPICRPYLDRP